MNFFYEQLQKSECLDCGERNIVLLDFDHRDPSTKVSSVSLMKLRYDNIPAVAAEMLKCDVRCVRCHRLKTAKEQDWYSHNLMENSYAKDKIENRRDSAFDESGRYRTADPAADRRQLGD